jgi:hypothetical protein
VLTELRKAARLNPFVWQVKYNGFVHAVWLGPSYYSVALEFFWDLIELMPSMADFTRPHGEVDAHDNVRSLKAFRKKHREELHKPFNEH